MFRNASKKLDQSLNSGVPCPNLFLHHSLGFFQKFLRETEAFDFLWCLRDGQAGRGSAGFRADEREERGGFGGAARAV